MTRQDLVDWVQQHGCEIQQLPEINNSARAIKFINPTNKGRAYINTPVNDTIVVPHVICTVCVQLGIPIPDIAIEHEALANHFKERRDVYGGRR